LLGNPFKHGSKILVAMVYGTDVPAAEVIAFDEQDWVEVHPSPREL